MIVPCAKWTPDCQGKWDYDGPLISISCRYWPRGGGFWVFGGGQLPEILPSAVASIHLNHGTPDENDDSDYSELAKQEFEADTEAEVKAQVEAWVAEKVQQVYAAVLARLGPQKEGV